MIKHYPTALFQLGKTPSSFITISLGKLNHRSLEVNKINAIKKVLIKIWDYQERVKKTLYSGKNIMDSFAPQC